jgi:hypothetical protein
MQFSVYGRARAVLQLEGEYSPSELKAAYRRAVRRAPPDRDPEAFQRVRAAYELLNNPLRGRQEWLLSNVPHCAPPLLDASSTSQPPSGLGHAAFELLVRNQNIDELLPAVELDSVIEEVIGAPAAGNALHSIDTRSVDTRSVDTRSVDTRSVDTQMDKTR